MVKNSKYLVLLICLTVGIKMQAQIKSEGFSPIKRDMEITRVTFENYLKKYDEAPLLNNIRATEATYTEGKGVEIKVEAPNAEILMNTQFNNFKMGDDEILDTFYTEEIINLQQKRLEKAISRFVVEFRSYLPKLKPNETFSIVLNIADAKRTVNGKEKAPSPKAGSRAYHLSVTIKMSDLNALDKGELSETQFSERILIEKQ
uniref:hypothetical protein n=1 Tax=Roseivirga sp. TaxID=1964215 RepID=UPI004047FD79